MTGRTALHLRVAAFGLLLGFSLSRMGFSDWGEVHRMFTLADLRLIYTFAGAVVLTGVGFAMLAQHGSRPHAPLHRGCIPGGVLFGAGWAITGACPSIPLVQLGEGQVMALASALGIALGALAYHYLAAPRLQWDTGTCG